MKNEKEMLQEIEEMISKMKEDKRKTSFSYEKLKKANKEAMTKTIFEMLNEKEYDIFKIKALLEMGADVNSKRGNFSSLIFSSIYRKDISLMSLFIQYGADVNVKIKGGITPLHVAVLFWDDSEAIEILLENGADAHSEDDLGLSPFDWAKSLNKLDIVYAMEKKSKGRKK
jgi:ankyrin repeat protein